MQGTVVALTDLNCHREERRAHSPKEVVLWYHLNKSGEE